MIILLRLLDTDYGRDSYSKRALKTPLVFQIIPNVRDDEGVQKQLDKY